MLKCQRTCCGLLLTIGAVFTVQAATPHRPPDPASLIQAQRKAMEPLKMMDGVWRGTASTTGRSGEKHVITQTERVGPMLGGSIKVMEGRGYEADGKLSFNAFGIISYDPASQSYSMHATAQGHTGDFAMTVTDDGFNWSIPAGPMTMRYTAVIKDGIWHELGVREMPGKPPVQFFEMKLKRAGDTDWPAAGAVPMKP